MTKDARIDQVLSLVLELANGNLDARLEPTSRSEPLDGVIEGLNMLAEELSASAKALKRSEESFRSLIEGSPDAIFVHRYDKFLYANAAALSLLGCRDASEVVGSATFPLLQAVPAIEGAEPRGLREGCLTLGDGRRVHVEVASIPVNFDGREATLSTVRDVSARKQLTAKMMEMDRMIAVGTLAAGVGHEINNPLCYVVGNLDYALDVLRGADGGVPDASKLAAVVGALVEAREGAERVRRIVHDLRSFSSMPNETETVFDVTPVLESAIHMAFNEIRHRARLVRDYADVPRVRGCASRLAQVFLNLLVNAAHAVPVGSAHKHRITVRTGQVNGRVCVEIKDTGVGIDPDHLRRIFDPFFTTKPVGQGTGLGLFICKRIVTEHQGTIEVESRPGVGSTFRVVLASAGAQAALPPPKRSPSAQLHARKRVLVIDDEPEIGRSLMRALKAEHDVSAVTCAREALARLLTDDLYDAVLCDVMMPEMTGVELYAELERRKPELAERILFFTGGAFTPSTQAFVQRMAGRCFEKPFNIGDVKRKLAEVCTGQ
jgi:two-component system cell cycle sensor histidine kinase/response regulator CckA